MCSVFVLATTSLWQRRGIIAVCTTMFYLHTDEKLVHFCETQATRHGSVIVLCHVAPTQKQVLIFGILQVLGKEGTLTTTC